ncbi:Phosphatidylinositol glycan anchor biosynthesis class N [Carabus blaptoides fortunei]
MTPFKSNIKPPAKRLVFIVSDGLRAETLYGSNYTKLSEMENIAPYLSSIVHNIGCWGTSHTRVPTESRPGHVALIAGIYEDPSAVAKGWKENPVDFDTVFNESRYTWSWGSPDILPMFTKVSGKHVFAQSYSAEEEDFSGKQSTALLDKWVFDHFKQFLFSTGKEKQLSEQIRSDKVIFFLHLLGMDTAGHTHKPYSEEHIHNLLVVDEGVKEINDLVNNFYKDNGTVFIFTSDHGMTDWGSHGAGSKFETETPFIAWGAGIKRSVNPVNINQADIAPLISTLIGIPIPVNSVGILPTETLHLSMHEISSAMYANAKQICAQFKGKQQRTKANSFRIWYYEFADLQRDKLNAFEGAIELTIHGKEYAQAIKLCRELIELSLRGLDYYQNYYQRLLLSCVVLSYVGWIVLLFLNLTDYPEKRRLFLSQENIQPNNSYGNKNINVPFAVSLVFTFLFTFLQSLPYMYYIYFATPQCIFWAVCHKFRRGYNRIKGEMRTRSVKLRVLLHGIVYLIGVEILVWCFFNRAIISIPMCIMAVWPSMKQNLSTGIKLWWCISCITLAVFPLMPVVGTNFDLSLITRAVLLWIACAIVSCFLPIFRKEKRYIWTTFVQIVLLIIVLCNLIFIDSTFGDKQGLARISQVISWLLLGISVVIPLFGSNRMQSRLVTIMLSFVIPFISLSVSYEPMFMLNLFLNLMAWLSIEMKYDRYYYIVRYGRPLRTTDPRSHVNFSDFRRAYLFLLYSILAFFGLGNIASLNSFDPMWVRCYLTVFSPFTMAALILFKTLIPYLAFSFIAMLLEHISYSWYKTPVHG